MEKVITWYLIGIVLAYILMKIVDTINKKENTWRRIGDRIAYSIGSWIGVIWCTLDLLATIKIPESKSKPPKWL